MRFFLATLKLENEHAYREKHDDPGDSGDETVVDIRFRDGPSTCKHRAQRSCRHRERKTLRYVSQNYRHSLHWPYHTCNFDRIIYIEVKTLFQEETITIQNLVRNFHPGENISLKVFENRSENS